ncbi:MAG: acyltransferase family protein [Steroidobacteraceae bacterium]
MIKKPESARQLVSLQYLRAVAALLVVFLHATIQVNNLRAPNTSAWLEVGKCGVDIFFVLSGFVMWASTAGRSGVLEFLRRRLVRIVPLYWIVTLAAAGVALVAPQLLNSTRFDLHHVLASLFFIPWRNPVVPFEPGADLTEVLKPLITPGWTLNFEMFFYAQFALALLVPQRLRVAALVLIITGVYVVFSSVSATADVFTFYGSTLVFEFLAGSVLAAGIGAARAPASGAGTGALPVAVPVAVLLAAFAVLILDDAWFTDKVRAAALGIPAVVLVGAAVAVERAGRLPFLRLLDELGNASYSIYITHIFSVAGMRIVPRALGLDPLVLGRPFFIVACVVLAASVGLAVHLFLEKPLIRRLNRGRLPVSMTIAAQSGAVRPGLGAELRPVPSSDLAAADPSTSVPSPQSRSS